MLVVKIIGLAIFIAFLLAIHRFNKKLKNDGSYERKKLEKIPYALSFLKIAIPVLYVFFSLGIIVALLMMAADIYE